MFSTQRAPPMLLTPVANLPLVSTTPAVYLYFVPAVLVAKFAAGVVDTGGAP
jgi:hypothetical protein